MIINKIAFIELTRSYPKKILYRILHLLSRISEFERKNSPVTLFVNLSN